MPGDVSRRNLLSVAGGIAALTVADSASAPAFATAHPDVELLALGREHEELRRSIHDLSSGAPEVSRLLWAKKDAVEARIMEKQPRTAAGMAVLLFVVYDYLWETTDEFDGPAGMSDMHLKLLWTAIQSAKRMGALNA